MKIRQGRRNPHTLYVQLGDEPDHDRDISIGYVRFPEVACWLVMELDGTEDAYQHLPDAMINARMDGA